MKGSSQTKDSPVQINNTSTSNLSKLQTVFSEASPWELRELPDVRQCRTQGMLHYLICLKCTNRMLVSTVSVLHSFPVWFLGCFTCFGRSIPPSCEPEEPMWAAGSNSEATVPHPPLLLAEALQRLAYGGMYFSSRTFLPFLPWVHSSYFVEICLGCF